MGDKSDDSGEVLRGAARAYSAPADADLTMLLRLDRALHTVPVGAAGSLPWQRPPQRGEEGLATRHR
ncbi:MAG: hypothetical protein BGO37_15935 [Cellulomonas sp. 73-92]|uniref:hypothetical protein n=1 Tax=Cellulomonas sp. 73-92 TaxID=1895740 RepID=UPI00092718D6|nr:hypothetical protein [Cellulomonas sp. 73-92]OJV80995.1 MAG: hypothetical protein BGO37_15935 [Cellulomonas sp. 73-92]